MSNEAITWAYKQPITTGAKFVLVALADLADEDHSCYPGQAKLAQMTGQSDRSVRRQLVELEAAGYVARAHRFDRSGHRTSDRYVLPVGQQIPTGQDDHRSYQPPVRLTTGQVDHRPTEVALPDTTGRPTGQDDQVSLREPTTDPSDISSGTDERDDVTRLCAHLADRIEGNGSKRPRITKRWRDEARRLMDLDCRPEAKIHVAIDWCQDDPFWRANILSMPKLREKYDQMSLAARRGGHTRTHDADDHIARAARRLGVTA